MSTHIGAIMITSPLTGLSDLGEKVNYPIISEEQPSILRGQSLILLNVRKLSWEKISNNFIDSEFPHFL